MTGSPPPAAPAFMSRLRARGLRRAPRPAQPPGPWVLLAAWGPCGYAPVAPGTFGTLGAIPVYLALSHLSPALYLLTVAALTALGAYAAQRAGAYWGVADASPIVVDEVAGYLVTMALVPFSWPAALLGFLLFRVFDVLKPWPASAFDRVKNGFGVVMDDVAAGVFAWAALQLVAAALRLLAGCDGAGWWCAPLGS
ncbi:phosphatidylglycerophosphatase A [Anaeromyxobacter sp. Fw109-5]|uniref:phosphatidylglycerophosphatase A family protein n=1 Tax=Anaeromyxobacter sp. (strain Fw109-5) TaxID=404589 RepID=UPI0003230EC7|nr:phosphatidylglycerophosphatase A [Anaeromyxobacter sp. Fw109-5]